MASLQSTTINGSLSTNTGKIALNSVGGWNDTQALLTVGSGGDGRIQTRHIWGKSASSDATDHLWLQYSNTGQHVQIGTTGGGNNLYVSGDIYAGGYFSGNLVLNSSNYANYTIDNTTAFKHFAWDNLASNATQARRFEIARIGIDPQNWNSTGTFEVELSERYYLNGLKKRYVVWYGYSSPRSGVNLVEMIGYGFNGFRVVIGTEVVINANQYYLPVYVDVRNYSQVSARVITSRLITTNSTPPVNYTYINNNPSPVNISDFAADSTVYISNAASAYTLNAGLTIGLASGTMISSSAMTDMIGWNTSYGAYIGSTVGSTTYIYGNGSFYDGSANRTLLHSANVGTYAFPRSGSWAADLVSSYGFTREHGMQMTGGSEFVVLSKSGQGYLLVDGSYYAAEAGGFYSTNNSSGGTLLGFYADTTTSLNFNTATVKLNSNQILHAGNYNSYAPTLTGTGASGTWGISITGNAATATNVAWSGITSKPTTLSGFGITDGIDTSSTSQTKTGVFQSNASLRAPIFYDSNDTNYYVDPASTSILNTVSSITNTSQNTYPSVTTASDIYASDIAINSYHHGDSLTYDVFQFNAPTVYETKATSGSAWTAGTVQTNIFKGDRIGSQSVSYGTYQVRWTWNATIGYKFFKSLYLCNSTNGHSFTVTIEYSGDGSSWTTLGTTSAMSNWPGHSWYHRAWNNSGVSGYLRLTITPTWNATYPSNAINFFSIRYFCSYGLDEAIRLFDWDYDRNFYLPSTGSLITRGRPNNIVYNASTNTTFGNILGGSGTRSTFFCADSTSTGASVWWGRKDGSNNNVPCGAIDSADGTFTHWVNAGGTGGAWTKIFTVNTTGITMDNGNFVGNLTGNVTGTAGGETFATVTGRGSSTTTPISISSGTSQPLQLTTSSGAPWAIALVRSDISLTSRVFAHNSPYNCWYFEHNISIAGNTNWHSGNDGAGSGLDADLLDGYNSATAATANTIVLRDGSGHITGNYLFGNYVNSSDNVPTVDNISYVMAKFGDNYYRSASAAKVAGFISGQSMNINGSSTSCTGNAATATNSTQLGGYDSTRFLGSRSSNISAFDFNNLTSNDIYSTGAASWAGSSNYPTNAVTGNSYQYGTIVNFASLAYSSGILQTYWPDNDTTGFYFRQKWSTNAWTGRVWQQVLTNANYNSFAPTLTGTGASGSWGISITGNAATVTNGVYTNIDNVVSGTIRIDNISNSFVNTVATANRSLTIYQNTVNADAYMTFHIGGDYAGYFGLGGAENDLVWGGWSVGNNRYRILHSGNAAYAWNMNQNVRTTDTATFAGVRAGDGSLSAPSYSFSSDTNTGMYLYGADILGMSAGGVLGFAMSSSSMSTILPYLFVGGMTAWNTTTPGTTKGFLHLGDASSTANSGVGITWGARDSSSGTTAQAGIYVITDGSYGTKMYFATTNNYGTGAQMAMRIEHTGDVIFSRGNVGVGTSPAYKLDVNGACHASSFPTSSDARFKKNIKPIQNSLDKINKINGVVYEWNEFVHARRDGYELNTPIIGVIAQDLEKVLPEVVSKWSLSEDCPDARAVDYIRIIPVLIEAIKELNNKNSILEARILALENKQ